MASIIDSSQKQPIPDHLTDKILNKEASQLAFDLDKRMWIFTTSSMMKIARVVSKELTKHAILGGIVGAVCGSIAGILLRKITCGSSLSYGII